MSIRRRHRLLQVRTPTSKGCASTLRLTGGHGWHAAVRVATFPTTLDGLPPECDDRHTLGRVSGRLDEGGGMLRRRWLGGALTAGAVAVGALALALSACGGSSSVNSELQEQADQFLIGEIEADFHESMTKKDIEQMMSLYAPNATVTIGPGKTATGTSDIREAWMTTTPFQPETNWISDHPAYK